MRYTLLFLAMLLPTADGAPQTPTRVCQVTIPNKSQRPGGTVNPYSHGNGRLWTILWPEGTVVFQPNGAGVIGEDGSLSMKWPWYRGVKGRLTIRGRRLDAPAPPLRAEVPDGYRESGFQPTALIFPTQGCWEVTGQVGEVTLTFVTRVVKVEQPAVK